MDKVKQGRKSAAILFFVIAGITLVFSPGVLNSILYRQPIAFRAIGMMLISVLPYVVIGVGLLLDKVKFSIAGVGFGMLSLWSLVSLVRSLRSVVSMLSYSGAAGWISIMTTILGGVFLLVGGIFAALVCFFAESGKEGLMRSARGLRRAAFVFFLLNMIFVALMDLLAIVSYVATGIFDYGVSYGVYSILTALINAAVAVLLFVAANKALKALTYQPKAEELLTSAGPLAPEAPVMPEETFSIDELYAPRAAKPAAPEPVAAAPAGVADQLKQYKDLLDSGILTQEEFDAKKKQLLGL